MKKLISDIIGSNVAISPTKGNILYEHFLAVLKSLEKVEYSFSGLQDCSSAFCNASIGKLYMNFSPSQVAAIISFTGFESNEIWIDKVNRAINLGTEVNFRNSNLQALEAVMA